MSKKLNIIETMKMPIGTEFEVIFDGKKIPNNTMVIYRSLASDRNTKHIDWKSHPDGTFMKPYDYLINGVFIPIQQPVSFMEAINSGKRVKAECDGYFKDDEYNYLHEVLTTIIENNPKTKDIALNDFITRGKWYIEESEDDSNE